MLCLITGANRGLGFGLARSLASDGHRIVLACRTQKSCSDAIATLIETHSVPRDRLQSIVLDLNSSDSIVDAAADLRTLHPEGYDVIVNNAAIAVHEDDSVLMQTDFHGTVDFILLCPSLLRPDGPKRIVNVSSRASVWWGAFWDKTLRSSFLESKDRATLKNMCDSFVADSKKVAIGEDSHSLEKWGGDNVKWHGYTVAKTALNIMTQILHERWADEEIVIVCCCPGWCSTDLGRLGGEPPRTPDQGIVVMKWMVLNSDRVTHGGRFFHHDEDDVEEIEFFVSSESMI